MTIYGLFNMGNASKKYSIGKRPKMKKYEKIIFCLFLFFEQGPSIGLL
jgi:hypothetical protein